MRLDRHEITSLLIVESNKDLIDVITGKHYHMRKSLTGGLYGQR